MIDRVEIRVKAGNGGNGCLAFRREKHIPKGGPSGGDGGKGGDVILRVDINQNSLLDFYYLNHYKAKNGKPGEGSRKKGADGEDKIIDVPPGTIVYDKATKERIADLIEGDFIIARGGKGGLGNAHFATPSNQAPRRTTEGKPGEEKELILELKLIADVGLMGEPNAGKSTLISRISKAKPKIASYPFTTKEPLLGIVELSDNRRFVVCDIPGIIQGAHNGKGMGLQFLRHVERTKILIILTDLTYMPEKSLAIIRNEIEKYKNGVLKSKPVIVVGSKIDAVDTDKNWLDILGDEAIIISSVTGENIDILMERIWTKLKEFESDES